MTLPGAFDAIRGCASLRWNRRAHGRAGPRQWAAPFPCGVALHWAVRLHEYSSGSRLLHAIVAALAGVFAAALFLGAFDGGLPRPARAEVAALAAARPPLRACASTAPAANSWTSPPPARATASRTPQGYGGVHRGAAVEGIQRPGACPASVRLALGSTRDGRTAAPLASRHAAGAYGGEAGFAGSTKANCIPRATSCGWSTRWSGRRYAFAAWLPSNCPTCPGILDKRLTSLASPTGFEPVLPT